MNVEIKRPLIPATAADLALCAHEPIHIPGAIQPQGILLGICPRGKTIAYASDNIHELLPLTAAAALGRPIIELIGAQAWAAIEDGLAEEPQAYQSNLKLLLNLQGGQHYALLHVTPSCMILEIELMEGDTAGPLIQQAQTILTKMRDTRSLTDLAIRIVTEIRRLTGYDRVMLYQFDADDHGRVVAEDRQPHLEPYLGLRYPASDIPAQARRLYLLNRLRVIERTDYTPVKIRAADPAAPPLDMSHCILRSVSPIHLEYLANMGVAATLTLSIIRDQRLWGMIVCHHATPMRLAPPVGATCDLLAQLLGLLIAELEDRDRMALQIDRDASLSAIAQHLDTRDPVLTGLAAAAPHLLNIVGAAGIIVRLGGLCQSFGKTPDPAIAGAILTALRGRGTDDIITIDNLAHRHPQFAPWQPIASGILLMPISSDAGDVVMWFRPEVVQTVTWGGDPKLKAEIEPLSRTLSPRKSFAVWKEIVTGVAEPWNPSDLRAAAGLRRILTRAVLRHTENELFRVSNSDPLTGLANRNVLNQRLAEWRLSETPVPAALLFFDLDRFKTVNDSLGHYAGDDLLRETAKRLIDIVPPPGLLVRLGGDEFVIFHEGLDPAGACALAESVLRMFNAPFTVAGRQHRASTSIGLAHATAPNTDLLREADAAMYAAKRQGGNRYLLFEARLHETARNRLQVEQDLFLAIERREMSVAYQPIVALPGAEIRAYEALARWYHAERGWISPAEFIPLAEETGQIDEIGRFVAAEAIATLAALPDPSIRMTINVSGHQLLRGTYVEELAQLLAAKAVDPRRITIEITESTLMDDDSVRELERARQLGCRVALDDFGTGYSSLAYLQRLPVDTIKIDRSFVSPLGADEKAARFVQALIALVHTLGLSVVAEGVETPRQAELLTAMSCRYAQGYHFGRPSPTPPQDGLSAAKPVTS
jgi:diguanylate cyclase (GGDEF)-like protein